MSKKTFGSSIIAPILNGISSLFNKDDEEEEKKKREEEEKKKREKAKVKNNTLTENNLAPVKKNYTIADSSPLAPITKNATQSSTTQKKKTEEVAPVATFSPISPMFEMDYRPETVPGMSETIAENTSPTLLKNSWYLTGREKSKDNIAKTILGTVVDSAENFATGILGIGETALDSIMSFGSTMANAQLSQSSQDMLAFKAATGKKKDAGSVLDRYSTYQKQNKNSAAQLIQQDLYNESEIAKKYITTPFEEKTGINAQKASVLGEMGVKALQSAGQLSAMVGLSALGVPGELTIGLSSFGGEMENALKQGASYEEATLSGLISATGEILSEKLSGGIKLGGKTLDERIIKPFVEDISNKAVKTIVNIGVDAFGEGLEEIFSGVISNFGSALYKEESIGTLIASEEARQEYAEDFFIGALLGGGSSAVKTVANVITNKNNSASSNNENKNKAEIKLTDYEQKVVDKETENRIAEEEKDGNKLSSKEKKKIREKVIEDLDKGYISTDTIESVLGGEDYAEYDKINTDQTKHKNSLTETIDKLQKEYDTLNKMKRGDMTGEQQDRQAEIKEELKKYKADLENLNNDTRVSDLKTKLSSTVRNLVKDTRLEESYKETSDRRSEALQVDMSKYEGSKNKEAVKKTLENAVNANANNTNRVRDSVEMQAKLSAETGIVFDYKTKEQIKTDFLERQSKEIEKIEAVPIQERTKEQNELLSDMKKAYEDVKSGKRVINGYADENGIVLNINEVNSVRRVSGHEITHSFKNNKSYNDLKDVLFAYAKTKGVNIEEELKIRKADYQGVPGADAEAELVSDLVGDYIFTDYDFIKSLSTENRNVFQKVYDEIKYLYKMATAGSKEARELEKVKRNFEKALTESVNTKSTTDEGGVRYDANLSFDKDANITYDSLISKPYMSISKVTTSFEDVSNLSRNEIIETAHKKLSSKKNSAGVITIHNIDTDKDIYVGKKGLSHSLNHNYEYTAMVTLNLESYLENAIKVNEAIADKNRDYDSDILLGYGETENGEKIPAYFVVSKLTTGKNELVEFGSLYSINAKKIAEDSTQGSPGFQSRTSANISIAELLDIVNDVYSDILPQTVIEHYGIQRRNTKLGKSVKFSLSEPIEETKDLIAMHNVTASKLSEALKLGGLPSPSIAITKTDIEHSNYGEITLLMNKNTIDPQTDSRNKVYGSDAWTPTISNARTEYEVDFDKMRALEKKLSELGKKAVGGVFASDSLLRRIGIEDSSTDNASRIAERLAGTDEARAAYLASIGENIEPEYKVREFSKFGNDALQTYIDNVGVQHLATVNAKISAGEMTAVRSEEETVKKIIRDNYEKKHAYFFKKKPELKEQRIKKYMDNNVSIFTIEDFVENAWQYYQDDGSVTETIDRLATSDKLREAVNDSDVKAWLEPQIEEFIGEAGIYNGQDLFDSYGNRKSFWQTHYEYTAENIVKAMQQAAARGEATFGANANQVIATATPSYNSIEEIHADKGRLQLEEAETYSKILSDIDNALFTIEDNIMRTTEHHSDNTYDEQQIIGSIVTKAATGTRTVAAVQRAFAKEDYKITVQQAEQIIDLYNKAAKVPTGYFEAKPERVVGFDEVAAFIIPNDTDIKLKQELLNRGYNIAEYDPNIKGQRQKVVNQFEKYKFSLSDVGKTDKRHPFVPYTAEDVSGKDFTIQEGIAPIKEDVKTQKASVNEGDIAPVKETPKTSLDIVETDEDLVNEDAADVKETAENISETISLDEKTLDNIAKTVRKALSLTPAEKNVVKDIVQKYSTSENSSVETLFNELKEKFAERTFTERVEEISDVKHALRGQKISVSQNIKTDIPDYSDFVRRNFGKIIFSKDGLPVDTVYQGLSYSFPEFFPETIGNATDQLLQMSEVANMETYKTGTDMLSDENIMEVAETVADVVNTYKDKQRSKEAEKENRPMKRSELHGKIIEGFKAAFRDKGFDMDEVLLNAKNLSTLKINDTKPNRVMKKTFGFEEGDVLADLTVNKVAQNESEGIKWLNSFLDRKSGLLAKISEDYEIKPGSKESAAAQMYAEGFYVNEKDEIIEYGDRELIKDFKDPKVRENIIKLARDERIRQIYDETLEAINEARKRNLYPEISRLDNYFLHFRAMGDTFSRIGIPFNKEVINADNLPTNLNGVTLDLKPGQPYFASAKHREGIRTSFDLLGGLEKYLTSAKNQIYHIDDIQNLRALRNYIAEMFGEAQGMRNLDNLSEEDVQAAIKEHYNKHLSNFAKFLNEEANILAGKKSLIDRGVEGASDRWIFPLLDALNKQYSNNVLGFNVSSPLTNFVTLPQAFAKLNKTDFVKGFAQFVSNKIKVKKGLEGDGFAENSPVLIRRKGAEQFYRKPYEKITDKGYWLMGVTDDVSSEIIARAKYNELIRKGMDSQKAHFETDKWVSDLMGDRSYGQMPLAYNSKVLGLVTKFQLEVRNQLDSQFYDTVQEAKLSTKDIENRLERNAKFAAKAGATIFQLAVGQHVFGQLFEKVVGYNPAFDMIEVIATALGFDDDEDDEDTVLDNIEEGFLALMEDLPYTSILTGGRIPLSSMLPYGGISDAIEGISDDISKQNWKNLGLEALDTALNLGFPTGYGQLKKTAKGLYMFSDKHPIKGSYTDSGNLRFPVDDNLLSKGQAALFGQYASKNAREYFDEGYAPLKEKQIQEYIDVDMPYSDYQNYRKGLSGLETLNEKGDYIGGLDLPVSKKNILINNIADREEPIDMKDYKLYEDFEEFDFAMKNPEKYKVLQEQGISVKDYKENHEETAFMYTDDFSWAANNPEQYTLSKAITSDVTEYKKYTSDLYNIKADKDSNGNSINGSAKEKKIDYINSLPLDYGQRIILYRSLYSSKADKSTYNSDIIDYLNSRDDIPYDEKITILKELDFNIDEDGNISW